MNERRRRCPTMEPLRWIDAPWVSVRMGAAHAQPPPAPRTSSTRPDRSMRDVPRGGRARWRQRRRDHARPAGGLGGEKRGGHRVDQRTVPPSPPARRRRRLGRRRRRPASAGRRGRARPPRARPNRRLHRPTPVRSSPLRRTRASPPHPPAGVGTGTNPGRHRDDPSRAQPARARWTPFSNGCGSGPQACDAHRGHTAPGARRHGAGQDREGGRPQAGSRGPVVHGGRRARVSGCPKR